MNNTLIEKQVKKIILHEKIHLLLQKIAREQGQSPAQEPSPDLHPQPQPQSPVEKPHSSLPPRQFVEEEKTEKKVETPKENFEGNCIQEKEKGENSSIVQCSPERAGKGEKQKAGSKMID